MEDGVGFEPTRRFHVCWFSRPVPSTTRPPVRASWLCRDCGFLTVYAALVHTNGGYCRTREFCVAAGKSTEYHHACFSGCRKFSGICSTR